MRALEPSPRAFRLALLTILALALAGCGSGPTAPSSGRVDWSALRAESAGTDGPPAADASFAGFYPLQIGNHWEYDHSLGLYFVPTGGPPGPVFGIRDTRVREIVCVEQRAGHDYFVERVIPQAGLAFWVRYRQDDAGLFEADMNIAEPPSCSEAPGRQVFDAHAASARQDDRVWAALEASLPSPERQAAYRAAWDRIRQRSRAIRQALGLETGATPRAQAGGGVEAGEIIRLQYPLRPGMHWVIRPDPLFESTVEGTEMLHLDAGNLAAWRVRIDSDFTGPEDHVHLWFGRAGFLQLVAHFEDDATDESGNIIGRMIADESEELVELSLNGGRFAGN